MEVELQRIKEKNKRGYGSQSKRASRRKES